MDVGRGDGVSFYIRTYVDVHLTGGRYVPLLSILSAWCGFYSFDWWMGGGGGLASKGDGPGRGERWKGGKGRRWISNYM